MTAFGIALSAPFAAFADGFDSPADREALSLILNSQKQVRVQDDFYKVERYQPNYKKNSAPPFQEIKAYVLKADPSNGKAFQSKNNTIASGQNPTVRFCTAFLQIMEGLYTEHYPTVTVRLMRVTTNSESGTIFNSLGNTQRQTGSSQSREFELTKRNFRSHEILAQLPGLVHDCADREVRFRLPEFGREDAKAAYAKLENDLSRLAGPASLEDQVARIQPATSQRAGQVRTGQSSDDINVAARANNRKRGRSPAVEQPLAEGPPPPGYSPFSGL